MQFTLREYGHVGVSGETQGLDYVAVPKETYQQLKDLALKTIEGEKPLLRPSKYKNQETLQVLNYVGVLGISEKSQLEILPKTTAEHQSYSDSRALLWKMLQTVTNLTPQESNESDLSTLPNSWLESLTRLVLQKISSLVRGGIKRDYVRREEQTIFLKGQLQVAKQMRARPGTEHRFHVSYDQYITDRPENRLLKSTLIQLNKWSSLLQNKRLCRELLFTLDDVPSSSSYLADLKRWRTDRGMAHYQPLLPWIELILSGQSPVFTEGKHHGISLLFPMEKLFEEYVFKILRKKLPTDYRLITQASSESLVIHKEKNLFRLKPDGLIIRAGSRVAVLDTKWKLLDDSLNSGKDKYKLSQADFYQMFAYGMKYLDGIGDLILIYPSHEKFDRPLQSFDFDSNLRLWVVPFDLKSSELIFDLNTTQSNGTSSQTLADLSTNQVEG